MTEARTVTRPALVRRGLRLNYITIGYNTLEAIVSMAAGLVAGSVSLIGFGVDSVIEVTASAAAQWRLRADLDPARRAHVERVTHRVIGGSFLALSAYVTIESVTTLVHREPPDPSLIGLGVLVLSAIVMPLLAHAKRQVAQALSSHALEAEAAQTTACAYLSIIALTGVALNTFGGWWWADPVAALIMVPILVNEGIEGLRGESCCDQDCGSG
jgi:divalent metal cation (Fe/Co/Zn/Cd) transporter